ncbi:uncharacterized protein PFL1_03524 [Pseudozyma flocculosa PF-1]|uniref:Alpha-galactosidase n=2 Tax=Pseudozyma flocculosa TaxID=84751 RepID=A0A5C3F4U5_9BASI|nr:uncharacterized protein PFL1_03524 [Pseudozyma flocculosa PF-1]EPQ28720.1 hypothetical protein PFL1_03524 [Pseudozyma flocculosa PF-1]SPO39508.1 uncharacterized protein PSFLO_04989 [Pseudozyma flocculosa]
MASHIVFEPQLNTTTTHRLDPHARNSTPLTFAAHVSTQQHRHTADILSGAVKIQLWTNLPLVDASTADSVGGSGTPSSSARPDTDGSASPAVPVLDDASPVEGQDADGGKQAWRAYDLGPAPFSDAAWSVFCTTLTTVPRAEAEPAASPSSGSHKTYYGFTYRLAFPDGRMEWLSYPHQDGRIKLVTRPASSTSSTSTASTPSIDQVLAFADGVTYRDLVEANGSVQSSSGRDAIKMSAAYVQLSDHRGAEAALATLQPVYRSASGIVEERTKSTWCTSRTFAHPSHVSPDFGASYLLFALEDDDAVLAVMPAISDPDRLWDLTRSRHPSAADGQYSLCCRATRRSDGTAKVAFATGPRACAVEVMEACRRAARILSQESVHAQDERKDVSVLLGRDGGYSSILTSASAASLDTEAGSTSSSSSDESSEGASAGLPASSSVASNLTQESFDSLPPTYESAMGLRVDASAVLRGDGEGHSRFAGSRPLDPKTGLGFCTWEAMGTEDRRPFLSKVVTAIEDLEASFGAGCITSVLIDDGWQDVAYHSDDRSHRGSLKSGRMAAEMLDVDEARAAAASGEDSTVLGLYVAHLRRRFPALQHVGCWMTLAGYWDGLEAGGEIATQLQGGLAEVDVHDPFREAQRKWLVPASDDANDAFWSRTFAALRQAGIDFVKVDAQAEWDWIVPHKQGEMCGVSAKSAFEAMQAAALRYMGPGSIIHSMSGSSATTNSARTLLLGGGSNGGALHDAPTSLRVTDDFFPDIPEAHRHHLVHNAYNSLLVAGGELRADADMFSSKCRSTCGEDWASYHASFRAYSDAKLWISEGPWSPSPSSEASVSKLLAHDKRGQLRTVQASEPARPLSSALFQELVADGPGPALKLCSRNAAADAASIGLWNARGADAESLDLISPSVLAELQVGVGRGDDLAIYRPSTGATAVLSQAQLQDPRGQHDPLLLVGLPRAGHDSLVVAPLRSGGEVSLGCLGLVDKFNGIHAMAAPGMFHELSGRAQEGSTAAAVAAAPAASPIATTSTQGSDEQPPLSKVLALGQSRWDAVRIMLLLGINTMFQTLLFGLGSGKSTTRRRPASGADVSAAGSDQLPRHGVLTGALLRLRSGVGRLVVPRSRSDMDGAREAYLPLITLGLGAGRRTLRHPLSTLKTAINPLSWAGMMLEMPIAGAALASDEVEVEVESEAGAEAASEVDSANAERLRYSIELLFAGLVGFVVRASAERLRTFRVKVDELDVLEREGIVQMRMVEEGLVCPPPRRDAEAGWETAIVTVDLEALAGSRSHPFLCPGEGGRAESTWQVELAFDR